MGYVILTGPKHAGKTSAGKELGRRLGLPFYDLDQLIENGSGMSPRNLYSAGPELFRREEEKALAALFQNSPGKRKISGVLAAGGGIIDNPGAMALILAPEHITVCLDISPESAWKRIAAAGELPPFLRGKTPEEAEKNHRRIHRRRAEAYRECAGICLAAEGKTPGELAKELKSVLESRGIILQKTRLRILPP